MSIYVAPRPTLAVPQKAATGTGVNYFLSGEPLLFGNSPQDRMKRAVQLGIKVPWIRTAERVITGLGATIPWHLEDADDVEVDDEYPNLRAQQARALIEKPQALLDVGQKLSRRELWAITLRHIGLCGNAFWLLDAPDVDGLPGAVIYIAPWRMTEQTDGRGNLTGWVVDADARGNGYPVTLEQTVQYVLEPPDSGFFGVGLVESAITKASISGALDTYLLTKIQSGGRKAGIVAPKEGVMGTDVYDQVVTDWRVASEGNDAARRLQVIRAPVDFIETGMDELTNVLREFMVGARDDLLGLWGLPITTVGLHDRGKGLGATAGTSEDKQALWENAVLPRLDAFREPLQFEVLDQWQRVGVTVELELELPEFEDDTPAFEKASKAVSQPLTNNQRLAILGFDPLPDYGPDGQPLGLAIYMPLTQTLVGQGPEANGTFGQAPEAQPVVSAPTPLQIGPGLSTPLIPAQAGKAAKVTSTARLREQIERTTTPRIRTAVAGFLAQQKRDIAARLRTHAEAVGRKPKDATVWFDAKRWDRALLEALKPYLGHMAEQVTGHIAESLPAKAGPAAAVERALTRGAARVTKINETTRDRIAQLVAEGIAQGGSVLDVADALETEAIFDDYRAELIARTELMDAYNGAAIGAYGDAGIEYVQAIDGDGDPECADRDGQEFSLEEADSIEDHPNGTLDWAPVLTTAKAQTGNVVIFDRDQRGRILAVRAPEPAKAVPMQLVFQRDANGRITSVHPEPMEVA